MDEKRKGFWDYDEPQDKTSGDTSLNAVQKERAKHADIKNLDVKVIDEKIHEATVLIEQIHQLYAMYLNGVEKRAPIEKVTLLESKVDELNRIKSGRTTAKFKINQFLQHYATMKDLWQRKLRDREKK